MFLFCHQVNGGSAAERAGLQAGDALIRVNTTDVFTLRHQEAQDAIRAAGGALELTVQRYRCICLRIIIIDPPFR